MKMFELLATPEQFCKKEYALDYRGIFVPASCKTAVRWSLIGAAVKCYEHNAQRILDKIFANVPGSDIWEYNDNADFEEIKALLIRLDL